MKIGQIHKNLMYSHNMVISVGGIGGIIANQIFFLINSIAITFTL